MPKRFLLLLFILIPAAFLLVYFSPLSDKETRQQFLSEYKIFPPQLPDSLGFAGERVPLEQFDVRERIEREILVNTYWQSQTILLLKRSSRWFPVIDSILKQNNIPSDFKYLSAAESGFINVVSPAGAVGGLRAVGAVWRRGPADSTPGWNAIRSSTPARLCPSSRRRW